MREVFIEESSGVNPLFYVLIFPLIKPSTRIVFCKLPFGATALCLLREAALNIESGRSNSRKNILFLKLKKYPDGP